MKFNYGTNPITGHMLFLNRKHHVGGIFGANVQECQKYMETEILRIYKSTNDSFYIAGDIQLFSAEFLNEIKADLFITSSPQYLTENKRINIIAIPPEKQWIDHVNDFINRSIEKMKSIYQKNEDEGKHSYIYICNIDNYLRKIDIVTGLFCLASTARALRWTLTYSASGISPFMLSQQGKGLIMMTSFLVLLYMNYDSRALFQKFYGITDDLMQYIQHWNSSERCSGLIKRDIGVDFEPFRY